MNNKEARKRFWELKKKVDAGKALRKPFQDTRDKLALEEGKLRDKVRKLTAAKEDAMPSAKLGELENEMSALARFLKNKVGAE